MSYDDLVHYCSEKAVKEAGRLREEGKEYIVQDGDIMEFRFNVKVFVKFKNSRLENFFPALLAFIKGEKW